MKRGLFLSVAALMVFFPSVRGNHHLSFASNTQVNITRDGCGVTKLCVETPGNCDPTGNSSCLFMSAVAGNSVAPNGTAVSFELRGDSDGYVALGLTMNASEGTSMLFVCARNNGSFFFRTMQRNNSYPNAALTPTNRRVTEIRGKVNGRVIKCEFDVSNLNSTQTRSSHVTYTVLLGSGTVNGTSLGIFNVSLTRGLLNLADPTGGSSNPTTPPSNTTTPPSNPTTPAPDNSAPASPLSITRSGCGMTKLCVETPEDCDPAGNSNCLFTSVVAGNSSPLNGTKLSIELRGDSDGYIALGLTGTASTGTSMLFVCAQNSSNNGSFFFRTMQRNNSDNALTPTDRPVTEVRGEVNGTVIKCVFMVPNLNSIQTRARDVTFTVLLGTGPVTGDSLGAFGLFLERGPLDLANPSSGTTTPDPGNTNTNTTPAPGNTIALTTITTTSGATAGAHPHALLLLSVLTLSIMLRN